MSVLDRADRFAVTRRTVVEPCVVRITAPAWHQIEGLPYRDDAEIGCFVFGVRDAFEIEIRRLGPTHCDNDPRGVTYDKSAALAIEDDFVQSRSAVRVVGNLHTHPSGAVELSCRDREGAEVWAREGNEDVVELLAAPAGDAWKLYGWIFHPDGFHHRSGLIIEKQEAHTHVF